MEILVFLTDDYSLWESFTLPTKVKREKILSEINMRIRGGYYTFLIWDR